MAKWYGVIGYGITTETSPGVWTEQIDERYYSGDVLKNFRRLTTADKLNDDLVISNRISVVLDPFAIQNFHLIRYVEFMGIKWKVSDIEVQYPRLYLSIGEVYNG